MSPGEEYDRRLRQREAAAANLDRLHSRVAFVRLLLAIIAGMLAWASFVRQALTPWWLALPIVVFIGVAVYHSHVLRRHACAQRAAAFYRTALARVEDRWVGTGQTGERFEDPHHIYAGDLDLFGRGGLFELISVARTRMGQDTLARWLLVPAPVSDLRERHVAVSELRDGLDLREDVAVLGEDAGVGVHPDALVQWAEGRDALAERWVRPVALILAVLFVGGVAIWWKWGLVSPVVVVFAIEAALWYRVRKRVTEVLHGTEHAFEDLELLSAVLARVEREPFTSPRLKALAARLLTGDAPASRAIAKLSRIVDRILARDNLILRALDLPLMYSVQVAHAAEGWRRRHGSSVRHWADALGEIEALVSLGTYSYEHPADPFPEFIGGDACFQAEELGHPLIPTAKCVRNSVNLCGATRLLLVSGSNMSGKSTLLRAIGINTVLAMAGAPVRARRLRLTPLQVGASIRINDSLQEGSSRFYAEITRLRKLFDLVGGDPPLLFLLDELLQGTNSKDRRIGAEGIVRALLERGTIGLVSTHDLALTDIGDSLAGRLQNVHFQDELQNGRILFDYKLREGVVAKSNGLELMRSIGLDV